MEPYYFVGCRNPLSNFYPCRFTFKWQGVQYCVNSSEQAYVLCKVSILQPSLIEEVMRTPIAADARRIGKLAESCATRDAIQRWHGCNISVMHNYARSSPNPRT